MPSSLMKLTPGLSTRCLCSVVLYCLLYLHHAFRPNFTKMAHLLFVDQGKARGSPEGVMQMLEGTGQAQ